LPLVADYVSSAIEELFLWLVDRMSQRRQEETRRMLAHLRDAFISFAAGCIPPSESIDFVLTPDGAFPIMRTGLERSDELLHRLRTLGIEAETIEEDDRSSGAGPGVLPDHWLLQDTEHRLCLVMVAPGARIDPAVVAEATGIERKLSVVPDRMLRSILKLDHESLSVLSVINDTARRVDVIIDGSLMNEVSLGLRALTRRRTTFMSPGQLTNFLELTKHSPRYLPSSVSSFQRLTAGRADRDMAAASSRHQALTNLVF
jgi:hypothetical protein